MHKCSNLNVLYYYVDAASSDGSGSFSAATIGGAAGGVVVFIIITVFCVVICCIIRSKRNKEKKSNSKELDAAIYYNKTYDDVNNDMNTNLHTLNATPSLLINNPLSTLESSFTQSSAEGI